MIKPEALITFPVRPDRGLVILGRTRSGKTVLGTALIMQVRQRPVLLIDPKQEPRIKALADYTLPQINPHLPTPDWVENFRQEHNRAPRLRYVPRLRNDRGKRILPGQDAILDALLEAIWRQRGWLVVFDELVCMADEHRWLPSMQALWQMGQGEPHEIGPWAFNQRAKGLPAFVIDQSFAIITFWLGRQADRDRLSERGVSFEEAKNLPAHWFLAHWDDPALRAPVRFPPIPLADLEQIKGGTIS